MPGGRPKTKAVPDAVKSVAKVLDILEHVAASKQPVSVSDLARGTGFNVSTAFRLVQTLVARGYVEQQDGQRSYVLGTRIYQLASAYLKGSDLATLARPQLEALRDEVGETVYLVIFSQGEIVQLCKADGPQVVSASIRSSEREPAYCTATGKVLLSGLSDEAFRSYLAGVKLTPYTAQTITSKARLEREIEAVRERGFRARPRRVRREPVLPERAGARSAQRRDRGRHQRGDVRSCASSAAACRAGASSWRSAPRSFRSRSVWSTD